MDSDTVAKQQTCYFRAVCLNMQCVQTQRAAGNTGACFFVAKGLISPFVVFLKTWSLLIWKYLCVQERRDSVHCSLKFALFTLLNSHTSLSVGQNDCVFLYNHQCTHPGGFSTARAHDSFPVLKDGAGICSNFVSACEAT